MDYSVDGMTWTASNITSGTFWAVYCAKGLWVAGGSSGLYYSTDGKSWTKSNVSDYPVALHYANGLWVAGGNGIYYSTDGMSWTQSNITSGTINDFHNANGIWLAGGQESGMYYSLDGKTWTQSNLTSAILDIHYANGLFVACGNGGIHYSVAWEPS